MPKTKISEYSTTNTDNSDIESINIAEGCAPSGINNAIRELMVHLKEFQTGASGDPLTVAGGFVASGGMSANTMAVTGILTASGGTILSGTNTISGASIISGNINSSGTTNTFSGGNILSGTNTLSGSTIISGNINSSGTNTFSSSQIITGNINSSGSANTFSGGVVHSGTNTFSGSTIFSGNINSSGSANTFSGNTVFGVNSSSDALRITQTGAGNALVVEDSANPDASPLIVDSSGNIITGATSVYSVSGAWDSRITSNAATSNSRNAGLTAFAWSTDNTGSLFHAGTIGFGRSGSNTIGTQAVVGNTAALGAIRFAGSDGSNFIESAQISAFVDGTPGTNDMPGRLVFKTTADGASSPTERMRIANTGAVGIGATSLTGFSLRTSKTITGATSAYGIRFDGQIQSDVTTGAVTFSSNINTAAASFNVSFAYGYLSELGTIGANSTIGTLYGFHAGSSLTGATNNYGFYSNIASGTGRWNFYANGTAENYLGGNLKIGATTARSTTAGTNHLSIFNGTAPAGTLTNGVTLYSASGDFNFMDSGGNGFKVGFRNIPPVGTKTGSYQLATADVGKYVQVSTGGSITIPDDTFAEGDAIVIFNNTSAGITITCTITTAYIAGTDADKASVTLATRGVANIMFISSTVCVITGNVS